MTTIPLKNNNHFKQIDVYHLVTYIDLYKFLAKPNVDWSILSNINQTELSFKV